MAKTSFSSLPLPSPDDLVAWYRPVRRDLPWRRHEGRAASPYHTWISEIMLQQTTVVTVIPYYERFISNWPDVKSLAAASEDEVLAAWAGLGYYSRARNLLACARQVVEKHDGVFPSDIDALKQLAGIGDYTANAIRAIAFEQPAVVVDGNVERVMVRVFAIDTPLNTPAGKKEARAAAASIPVKKDHGDYAQALMELGATVCTPRQPKCPLCPWQTSCRAFNEGRTAVFPVMQPKKETPTRHVTSFILMREQDGALFLRQRPRTGLLGGLWEFPSTPWQDASLQKLDEAISWAPVVQADWQLLTQKPLKHVFTHFKLIITAYYTAVESSAVPAEGAWFTLDNLPALATMTQKIISLMPSEPRS